MKKLLITGASGFLGSRIAAFYKDKYHILTPGHTEMDITDAASVEHYFRSNKPDFVIHCAAISQIPLCEQKPEFSWKVNVTGSENIAKTASQYSAKCILCSSDQVYCGSIQLLCNSESDPLNPNNIYGKEKYFAEKSCLQLNKDSVHLRLSWMYDAHSSSTSSRNDFTRQIINSVISATALTLSTNDKRGISDVWEVIKNIEKTFELPGGIYNFGSPNDKNTYQTALHIFTTLDYDTSLLQKTAFETARNLTMNQEKINHFGIYFSSTTDAVIRCLKQIH